MSTSDKPWADPRWVLAGGVALSLTIAGTLWGLSYLLPALFAAVGYLAAGAIHGTVSGAVAGWFGAVAFYGGTLIIAGVTVTVGIRVVNETAKKPFYAAVVILAVSQTFLLDMAKDLWPGEKVSKWLFKASTALLFAIAAALWSRGGWRLRTCAVLVFALMPVMVLAVAAGPYLNMGIRAAAAGVDRSVWFAFAGFACFGLVTVLLARLLRGPEYGTGLDGRA